jgi:hypothetical protein
MPKPHKKPMIIPELNRFCFKCILGKANPDHPISSKKPAGMPKRIPNRKKLGVKAGDTKPFKNESSKSIIPGGMSNATKYHLKETFHFAIRELKFLSPALPSIM